MKLLGWALIITGGGLAVYGVSKLLASRDQPEDGEVWPGSEAEQGELREWEQHLLDVEEQERNAHTSVRDLNDGV